MRTFKFRAFENKKMYYQVRCGGVFDNEPTAPTVWLGGMGWVNLTGGFNTIVMQYSGLKDKKGKEIYEGDIVESQYFMPSVVNFQDGCFLFGDVTYDDAQSTYSDIEWEVIGNIYENYELIGAEGV